MDEQDFPPESPEKPAIFAAFSGPFLTEFLAGFHTQKPTPQFIQTRRINTADLLENGRKYEGSTKTDFGGLFDAFFGVGN